MCAICQILQPSYVCHVMLSWNHFFDQSECWGSLYFHIISMGSLLRIWWLAPTLSNFYIRMESINLIEPLSYFGLLSIIYIFSHHFFNIIFDLKKNPLYPFQDLHWHGKGWGLEAGIRSTKIQTRESWRCGFVRIPSCRLRPSIQALQPKERSVDRQEVFERCRATQSYRVDWLRGKYLKALSGWENFLIHVKAMSDDSC